MKHQCVAQAQVECKVEQSIVGHGHNIDVGGGVEEAELVYGLGKDLVGKGLGVVVLARPYLQNLVACVVECFCQMCGYVAGTYKCYGLHCVWLFKD